MPTTLTEKRLREEVATIENRIYKSEVVDSSTKDLMKTFHDDYKDLIIESVLQRIMDTPDLRSKFTGNR